MKSLMRAGWQRRASIALGILMIGATSAAFGQTELLLVPNLSSNSVSQFTVNTTTGFLSPVAGQASTTTSNQPIVATTTPNGKFLYIGTVASGNVDAFVVNPDGTLTAVAGPAANAGDVQGLAIDASSRFLYATREGGAASSIVIFSINQTTGALTPAGTFTTGGSLNLASSSPRGIAIDSAGHLYVGLLSQNSVAQLQINSADGSLTVIGTGVVATGGTGTNQVAVAPANNTVYASNSLSSTITVLTEGAGGALSVASTTSSAGIPQGLLVTASGQFLIVANSGINLASVFTIGGGGALSGPTTAATGATPVGIAADPTGSFIYISNSAGGSVSGFRLTSGTLTPIGTFAVGSGPFFLTSRTAPLAPGTSVPALSTWGMVFLGMLLAGSSAILYKRAYR